MPALESLRRGGQAPAELHGAHRERDGAAAGDRGEGVTAICFALAGLALLLGGSVGYALVKLSGAADRISDATAHASDALVGQASKDADLKLANFEIEKLKDANAALDRLANSLEQTLAEYLNAAPNTDLAADDVRTRVLRISQDWARSLRAGEVPAEPAAPLSLDPAAAAPAADLRNPDGPEV